jgi:predicted HTH transcriptional regulator
MPPIEPLGSVNEPKVSEPVSIFSAPEPTPQTPKPNLARQLIAKAREAIQNRKRKKIDHVMDLFAKRTNITNSQVADFLHVSDATATRYLQILENENRIKQVGKTGKGVKYEKI